MNLVIRADASPKIGAGHVMRCLALGQAWQETEGRVTFVCADVLDSVAAQIANEQFELVNTGIPAGTLDDGCELMNIATQVRADAIVIDGYHFNVDYHLSLKQFPGYTLAIDDYGHLAEYQTDFVLNQNLGATNALYPRLAKNTTLLLGIRYALLRREFLECPKAYKQHNNQEFRILVTLGGADPNNALAIVLAGLRQLPDSDLRVRVITGNMNPRHNEIAAFVSQDSRFEVYRHVELMSRMYQWAHLAIAAGGSSNWEMCRFGLPRILLVLAENQASIAEALSNERIAVNLGDASHLTPGQVRRATASLMKDRGTLESAREIALALIDGQGAARCVEHLTRSSHERLEQRSTAT